MSFLTDLVTYIADNTSLVVDTTIFAGGDIITTPDRSVVIQTVPGGGTTESGVISDPIQVLAKELSYVEAETLVNLVHDLLENKPGFSGFSDTYYCSVFSNPAFVTRTERGAWVFSSQYLVKRR